MISLSKKSVDKYGKTFIHDVPVFKLDSLKNKLVKVDDKVVNTFAFVESNKTMTLQEMIKKHIFVESVDVSDLSYFDSSDIPVDINVINIESRKDMFLSDKKLEFEAKQKQKQLELEIEAKAKELLEKNKIENKEVK